MPIDSRVGDFTIYPVEWAQPAMIFHDLHHGAEIGCLRDLYRMMTGE